MTGLGIGIGVGVASTRSAAPVSLLTPSTTTPSTATSSPSSSSSSASTGSIADAVDPAIVDVTTTLAGGQGRAAGTGMVLTSSGEVLTNNHVIAAAQSISVQIPSTGATYSAQVLGYDVTHDVALLKLDGASGLTTINAAQSSSVSVGQSVVALGNALGQGGTPAETSGSIIATGQTVTASDATGASETLTGLIEFDAPIQPGDSGGPLVNSSGQVIGMDTAALQGGFRQSSASTVAYAIPIDTAMSIVKQIESGTSTSTVHVGTRAVLGVSVEDAAGGVTVAGVQSSSGAANAGIVAGDVITSVDGTAVSTVSDLGNALRSQSVGDKVTVVWTDASGAQHRATVTLTAGPPA